MRFRYVGSVRELEPSERRGQPGLRFLAEIRSDAGAFLGEGRSWVERAAMLRARLAAGVPRGERVTWNGRR